MTPAARERARARTPILIVSACAWAVLLAGPAELLHAAHGAHHGHDHHGHGAMLVMGLLPPLAIGWALMLVAMMLPLLSAPLRHVASRSFPARRARATGLFLVGYAAVWMAAGMPLVGAALAIGASPAPSLLAGLATALVVAWQASPAKQICFNRLHLHPALRAFGAAADRDAATFGIVHGMWCVGSCWGLMLLPMLVGGWHLALMACVSLWVWAEQLERPARPAWAARVPLKIGRLLRARAGQWRAPAIGQR